MKTASGARHLIFKTCIAAGFALGIVLLWQTISTYSYVAGNLLMQAAQRDAEQKRAALQRTLRVTDRSPMTAFQQAIALAEVINDSSDEWKEQVAWIRILSADGKDLATAGNVPLESLPGVTAEPNPPVIRRTDRGPALVTTLPIAFGRSRGARLEIAIYLDSVSASFASLRRNLITGVSASLTLMAALILLALRFPKYLRGQQVQAQVELARRVQADMLPSRDSKFANFEFAAECIPAEDVGGDFCDTFRVGGQNAFVIGDVSGKGYSAALLMAFIHGAIQSASWTPSAADHENSTRSLNDLLCSKTAAERFSTLFWSHYDPATSILRYVNAGHLPPLLIRQGEFGDIEVHRLETGGPVIGLIPGVEYTQGQEVIRKGDLLVAFSDGIVEASDFSGAEFGERRLIEAVRSHWRDSAAEVRDSVLNSVNLFTGEDHVSDDRTLLVVRFTKAAVRKPEPAIPETNVVEEYQLV